MELWKGRFAKELSPITNNFNQSIGIDKRMYKVDIEGSIAHTKMLEKQKIITKEDQKQIEKGLKEILKEIEEGKTVINSNSEDIHTFIEETLTNKIGDAGKKMHTARSRNDQVALDIRMYLKEETQDLILDLKKLIKSLIDKAKNNLYTIMPGYTHMQRAQPITFAHYLMAYVEMFLRDITRLENTYQEINVMPLGSCALAGTTYDLDREYVKEELGFDDITYNSLDGVSDRDFVIDLESNLSIVMMHLSRFSEEMVLWCSWEFKFIELDDSYSTGSSIMPQKKNPDITELIRGKTGRVYGNLIQGLTMMKSLPLAYNKDMQEDKKAIFDSIDTVKACIITLIPMIDTMTILKDNMELAAKKGFINATDCADYLSKKGMPFRDAYKLTGEIVKYAIDNDKVLDTISIEKYKEFSKLFEDDLYDEISLKTCIEKRNVIGGPAPEAVKKEIDIALKKI
ncbi:MAG: argininosuccinate lyase [Clostridia bacterium]|nr:argininosuccinate lyase [Clostridia bacterium]